MRLVRIEPATEGVRLGFKYDSWLVELVKTLPGHRFDRASKTWTVRDSVESVRQFFERNGVQVLVSGQHNRTASNGKHSNGTDWAVALLGECSPELRQQVFRALSKVLHPDTGGDQRLMQQLLEARKRTEG